MKKDHTTNRLTYKTLLPCARYQEYAKEFNPVLGRDASLSLISGPVTAGPKRNFLAIIGMLLVFSQCGYCLDIHVAPGGDDANPGSEIKPLKTLMGARDAVRKINSKMTGDIAVRCYGLSECRSPNDES